MCRSKPGNWVKVALLMLGPEDGTGAVLRRAAGLGVRGWGLEMAAAVTAVCWGNRSAERRVLFSMPENWS